MNERQTATKTLAIDASLHRYLKLLMASRDVKMNELTEPVLWELVRENREDIERMAGAPITIPDPQQLTLVAT